MHRQTVIPRKNCSDNKRTKEMNVRWRNNGRGAGTLRTVTRQNRSLCREGRGSGNSTERRHCTVGIGNRWTRRRSARRGSSSWKDRR